MFTTMHPELFTLSLSPLIRLVAVKDLTDFILPI